MQVSGGFQVFILLPPTKVEWFMKSFEQQVINEYFKLLAKPITKQH